MITAAPYARPTLRAAAIGAVIAVLVAGVVTISPPVTQEAAAAVTPPAGSETFRVSQSDTGSSTDPSLTPDGQRVFFTSTAADLVAGDGNGVADIFVSVAETGSDDPFTGAPELVSVPDGSLAATQANAPSSEPVASADGRYVGFASTATNLVADGGTVGRKSIYVRDTLLGKTFRVQGPAGEPDGQSYDPDISDDGRHLVFTSEAVNLSAGDTNGTRDAFVADLDANADGILGDLLVERFIGGRVIDGGSEQARISGNGGNVVFTAHQDSLDQNIPPTITSGDFVYYAWVGSMSMGATLVGTNAHHPTIDAGGETLAYIDDDECDNAPAIIAATLDSNFYYAALGTILTDRRVGYIADPVISADGSHVAWTTTVPEFDFNAPAAELTEPVVRMQEIQWFDSRITVGCFGLQRDWFDLAEGSTASVSASSRTIAFTAPATAPKAVFAMDTHSHEGLSVSSTQGQLVTTGFMTTIDIPTIPLTSLRNYASAIANSPIHNLPIHNLPIHNLPIHNLPIHNLPIHNLPIHNLPIHNLPIHNLAFPGGWAQVLADTPFAGELIQSVTLDEILAWAAATLADGSGATDAERAAALRIQSLTLGDLGLDGSGLDALTLASYILGAAPIGEVPIAGEGTTLERWQDLVDAQGLGFQVEPDWYLADLDAAGLDIERSGVDAVPLRSLPIDDTLLRYLTMTDLFLSGTPLGALDVSTLDSAARIALFGTEDATGPLQSQSFLLGTTAADLAAGAPDSVTVGILLMSVLDAASYPWEQIAASSFDPNLAEAATDPGGCDQTVRCGQFADFQYTFDPGPGEATSFPAPTASLTTPAGTASNLQYVWRSGPDGSTIVNHPYDGPKQVDGERLQIALPETAGGTVLSIKAWYTATTQPGPPKAVGELTSGALTASESLFGAAPVASFDDPDHNLVNGIWQNGFGPGPLMDSQVNYEWVAPQFRELNDEGDTIEGPAQDEDYYLVDPPPAGKRLVVSTNATDGQISLALYAPSAAAATLGVANAGVAPGTPVTEQSGPGGQPAESGADAGADVAGNTLVDQAVVGGDGTAQVEAASVDVPSGERLLVRVTSGNGQPSAALYSLRVQYIDEAPEVHCTPWTPAQTADPGVAGVSDPVTSTTNTIYLFDQRRYGDTYGAQAAADVRAGLVSLTGKGHVGSGAVDGAVLAVDTDPAVQAARTALDGNPCSMEARRALTSAINAFVGAQLGAQRAGISSVVIVGGDDIIPLAPVAQHTSQFTETSHAADLRLTQTPSGDPCPAGGFVDPCETPLSAAAATSHVLTDDPYGLAKAYESLGGFLYVPTVGLGRLVERPEQILAAIVRFVDAEGLLTADSTQTGGYGAWSELPQQVTEALAWRSPANQQFGDLWTATDLDDTLFPANGQSARVVSVNTHADETRMLPGVPGAASGSFADTDLFNAAGHENAAQLAGALIFGIGCHAGNNLPTAYYGDVTDWVDVFSAAGGYVGNTGFGLANNVTTALGERLLALYADWVGVSVEGNAVSAAGALTYAKQSYLGGLGLYSGYDEKVLMEAVYYGLPMYTFNDATKEAPLPDMPDLTPSTEGGLTTAGLSFHPTFQTHFVTDDDGREVEYLTVEGQPALASPGQPVIASVVKALQPAPAGKVARGALLTSLTSVIDDVGIPAVTAPSVGIPETTATKAESAFPSTFATISSQQTPTGPIDLLVVTPSRVQTTQGGNGITERFTDFRAEVVYGDATSTDTTAPTIDAIELPGPGGGSMTVYASDASGVAAMVLLVQPEGETAWQRATVQPPTTADEGWDADVPTVPFRWILQVVDGAGNVAVETARGHLDIAGAIAPSLGDAGPDVTIAVGERLLRAVQVTDPQPGDRLSASVAVKDAAGEVVSTSPATVETGPDGTTRALIDQTLTKSGAYTVKLTVCRGEACTAASFAVDIPEPNARPSVTVLVESDDVTAQPTSTLTALPTATDPEHDAVTLAYAWTRNGVRIPDQATAELDLDGIAQPGDVIAVTVTPSDAGGAGHAASAELLVVEETAPPAPPTITATAAKVGGAPYLEGSWSLSTVTVTFDCTAGAPLVVPCPAPQTVSDDTPEGGVTVTGTIQDMLGRTATAEVLVKVDRTAPTLAPVVTPSTVPVGGTATATPNATDSSSGVASQSCADPQTTTPGPASVLCQATDVAGNHGSASASYTVQGPSGRMCGAVPDRTALPPLNADGSSVFMRPSGVPVVFVACDGNGNPIGTKKYVTGLTLRSTAPLAASAGVNELSYAYVGTFKYTTSSGQWQGFIPTNKLAGGRKYTYRIDLSDGTSFMVTFGVR